MSQEEEEQQQQEEFNPPYDHAVARLVKMGYQNKAGLIKLRYK